MFLRKKLDDTRKKIDDTRIKIGDTLEKKFGSRTYASRFLEDRQVEKGIYIYFHQQLIHYMFVQI